jgi:hypothetical protein
MGPSRRLAFVLITLLLCAGCAHKRPAVARKPQAKPWIAAKTLCMLPMSKPPAAPGAGPLAAVMSEGWKARLDVPEGAQLVRIEPGARAGAFGTISIDLSDTRVEPDRKVPVPKPVAASQGWLTAEKLELIANPLLLDKAKVQIGLTATDARLDVRRDRKGGPPVLTLTDAKETTLSLELTKKDVDRLLLQATRAGFGRFGVSVDRTTLKLDVIDDRTIRVDLKLDARVGFLPAGLRFKARVDIDDKLNGTMTRLSCEGDQLLGPVISTFIDPALRKYEGRTRPLIGFEWGRMKLQEVSMRSNDSLRLDARFATEATLKPGAWKKPKKRAAVALAGDR